MKVFQELFIYCDRSQSRQLFILVEKSLPPGWVRDKKAEARAPVLRSEECYFFVCSRDVAEAAALISVFREDDSRLWVSNVVPKEVRKLSYDQYNGLLERFCHDVLKPSADSLSIRYELTKPEKSITDFMPESVAKKLISFSNLANKSTGSSHPCDHERWLDFLVSLDESSHSFDSEYLRRWLTEESGWPDDEASELVSEYEFAMGLLKFCRRRWS